MWLYFAVLQFGAICWKKNARDIMLEAATFNMLNYKQLDLLKQLKEQIKQDQIQRQN